jgi:CBS domain containing-hemolysin-like protein
MFGDTGIGIATGVMTFILLIFGEITPKSLFYNNAEKVAPVVAHPIYIMSKILYPVVFLIENISGGIVFLFNPKRRKDSITEEDIKVTLSLGEEAGVLDRGEEEMMQNIFEFGDTTVSEVMTPRNKVVALPSNMTLGDAMGKILESKYSRIPVYRNYFDNVIGILNLRQILKHIKKREFHMKLEDMVTYASFVEPERKIDDMMEYFRESGNHMAIVRTGSGRVKGVVTMEDVLEEIVGEIYDEPDQKRFRVRFIDGKTAIVNGDLLVKDLQEEIDIPFRSEKITLSELISARFDGRPKRGSTISMKNFKLIVMNVYRDNPAKVRRIKIVKVRGKIKRGI